jgi:ADP-heptose:LPS heptosyltransferase
MAANYNEQIASRVKNDRCIDLAGQTDSLTDFVNLLSLARVLVTNDSGPAHFASLVDVQSVVLFGPETPALYRPIGSATTVLYSNFSCSPCISAFNHRHTPCSDNKCLQAISVEQVYSAVTAAYRTTASHYLKVN